MAMASGQLGVDHVSVDNAHTVVDFQSLLSRAFEQITMLRHEGECSATGYDQQLAVMRVELRMAQTTAQPAGGGGCSRDSKFELVDVKAMSPIIVPWLQERKH